MARWSLVRMAAVLALALTLMECGQPGAPQAPSLQLAKAVEDVSASRKGDRVTVRWTTPDRFTDGRMIQRIGPTNICRAPGTSPAATCSAVGKLPAPPPAPVVHDKSRNRTQAEYTDVLPNDLMRGTGSVMYGVEVLNTHGRSVGVSNQVAISAAPTLSPPSAIAAKVGEDGVTLTWGQVNAPALPAIAFAYQVSRRGESGEFAPIANVPIDQSKFVDQTFEWEKKFEYRIAVVTMDAANKQVLVEGEDAKPVGIFAHDVFPPAQPRELQAVFSGPGQKPFIDLAWAPNLEPDLAGYNVFRHEEGTTAIKLNQAVVTSPAFRDENVEAGKQYFYSVSAVDLRGNESNKSSETSERVAK